MFSVYYFKYYSSQYIHFIQDQASRFWFIIRYNINKQTHILEIVKIMSIEHKTDIYGEFETLSKMTEFTDLYCSTTNTITTRHDSHHVAK